MNWLRIVQEQSTRPSHRFWRANILSKPFPPVLHYKRTGICFLFVTVKITEEAVKSVARKRLGGSGPGGTESDVLQGCILKFGDDTTRLHTTVETFVDWLANEAPPWAAYCAFMSGRLIALDKQPGVRLVGIGETW